jgi:4'-phosphopantetheinyl transferase
MVATMSGQLIAFTNYSSWLDRLSQEKVHIFRTHADDLPEGVLESLSPEEKTRSMKYHFNNRRQFGLTRGWIRRLIARYLDCDPCEISFTTEPKGKPKITGARVPLFFNLSHSQGRIAVIFSLESDVGIDVEMIDLSRWNERLNREVLCDKELKALEEKTDLEKSRAFFFIWAQKEAYLKAIGEGLSAGLSKIQVAATPSAPARLIRGVTAHDSTLWKLHNSSQGSDEFCIAAFQSHVFPKTFDQAGELCLD